MCAPPLALAFAGMQAASGLYSAFNQNQAGKAEGAYYDSLAKQSREKGEIALKRGEKQSELVQDTAKEEGKRQKQGAAEFNASQKARLAANGISAGSVTSQDIQGNTLSKEQMDEHAIRYNADVKSWEAETNAKYENWDAQNQANQYSASASNARSAGKRNAFGTILGSAVSIANPFIKR